MFISEIDQRDITTKLNAINCHKMLTFKQLTKEQILYYKFITDYLSIIRILVLTILPMSVNKIQNI